MSLTPIEKSVIKLLEAVARNQAAVQILVEAKVASAQGRAGQAPLLCAKCRFVPDATELSKSAFCPSCLTGFVERGDGWPAAPETSRPESDRRATGVPFGKGTPRIRSTKSAHAGAIDGQRID